MVSNPPFLDAGPPTASGTSFHRYDGVTMNDLYKQLLNSGDMRGEIGCQEDRTVYRWGMHD
jgi:hypothetical protein